MGAVHGVAHQYFLEVESPFPNEELLTLKSFIIRASFKELSGLHIKDVTGKSIVDKLAAMLLRNFEQGVVAGQPSFALTSVDGENQLRWIETETWQLEPWRENASAFRPHAQGFWQVFGELNRSVTSQRAFFKEYLKQLKQCQTVADEQKKEFLKRLFSEENEERIEEAMADMRLAREPTSYFPFEFVLKFYDGL